MTSFVGAVLAVVLGAIAGLHVYWAAGGRRGVALALPQVPGGRPRARGCILLAAGCAFVAGS